MSRPGIEPIADTLWKNRCMRTFILITHKFISCIDVYWHKNIGSACFQVGVRVLKKCLTAIMHEYAMVVERIYKFS